MINIQWHIYGIKNWKTKQLFYITMAVMQKYLLLCGMCQQLRRICGIYIFSHMICDSVKSLMAYDCHIYNRTVYIGKYIDYRIIGRIVITLTEYRQALQCEILFIILEDYYENHKSEIDCASTYHILFTFQPNCANKYRPNCNYKIMLWKSQSDSWPSGREKGKQTKRQKDSLKDLLQNFHFLMLQFCHYIHTICETLWEGPYKHRHF